MVDFFVVREMKYQSEVDLEFKATKRVTFRGLDLGVLAMATRFCIYFIDLVIYIMAKSQIHRAFIIG